MTTSTFDTLIHLNNKGVDLLTSGSIESASKHFRTALFMLEAAVKRTIAKTAPRRNMTSYIVAKKTEAATSAEADAASPQPIRPPTQGGVASLSSSTLDQSPRFYVSTKPVKIVRKNRLDNQVRASFASTAISFNLALSFQLLSLKLCAKSCRYRRSAIAFYGVTFKLRIKTARRSAPPSGTMALLDLAIINNLAVLHHQNDNEGLAIDYLKRLIFQIRELDFELATAEATGFVTNLIMMGFAAGNLPAAAAA